MQLYIFANMEDLYVVDKNKCPLCGNRCTMHHDGEEASLYCPLCCVELVPLLQRGSSVNDCCTDEHLHQMEYETSMECNVCKRIFNSSAIQ